MNAWMIRAGRGEAKEPTMPHSRSHSTYKPLKIDKVRSQLYQSIDRAESDITSSRTIEAHTAINDVRSRYDL